MENNSDLSRLINEWLNQPGNYNEQIYKVLHIKLITDEIMLQKFLNYIRNYFAIQKQDLIKTHHLYVKSDGWKKFEQRTEQQMDKIAASIKYSFEENANAS